MPYITTSDFELTSRTSLAPHPPRVSSRLYNYQRDNLDPEKSNPSNPNSSLFAGHSAMDDQYRISYSSQGGNPFHDDDRATKLEDFYRKSQELPTPISADVARKYHDFLEQHSANDKPQPTYRQHGMSHSLSEGNIEFRSHTAGPHVGRFQHRRLASDEIPIRFSEDDDTTIPSSSSRGPNSSLDSRGRSMIRTPSPAKLEDIKEANFSVEGFSIQAQKRSRSPVKQLFGEHGWLGKSMSSKDLPGEVRRKRFRLRELRCKLKERVENITPEMPKLDMSSITSRLSSPSKSKSKSPIKTRFHVSLSPPLQARLYSEVELMIVATANEFLQIQQREGRMSIDSLARVLEAWTSKNRPQVIEFLFDQATQRDLILYNLRTFQFYGPQAEKPFSINSMMQNWKALGREMSVRNFCMPDAVVRKNLVDANKVLEMLGAPTVTIVAFREIKERAEGIITEKTAARREYENTRFGVERKWEPPLEAKEKAVFNPFA